MSETVRERVRAAVTQASDEGMRRFLAGDDVPHRHDLITDAVLVVVAELMNEVIRKHVPVVVPEGYVACTCDDDEWRSGTAHAEHQSEAVVAWLRGTSESA